jgi:hypothetical protein
VRLTSRNFNVTPRRRRPAAVSIRVSTPLVRDVIDQVTQFGANESFRRIALPHLLRSLDDGIGRKGKPTIKKPAVRHFHKDLMLFDVSTSFDFRHRIENFFFLRTLENCRERNRRRHVEYKNTLGRNIDQKVPHGCDLFLFR